MNICPSCSVENEESQKICLSCGWEFKSENSKKSVIAVKSAPRPKVQSQIQIGTTVDRSGSSSNFERGIPQTLEIMLNQLEAKAKSVKVWLQSHSDRDYDEREVLHTDGGSVAQAIEDVKKIVYGGGGDAPETHLDALENVMKLVPWTADPLKSRGALIMFATSETKPLRSGKSLKQFAQEIRDKGLLLYLVCEPTPQLQELSNIASGLMLQISNAPKAEELQKVAAQLAASIVASVQKGSTVPLDGLAHLKNL